MKKHFIIIFTSCLALLIIVIPLLAIACGPDGPTPQDADNRRSDACELSVSYTPQNAMPSFIYSPDPHWVNHGYDCGTTVTVEAITYGPALAIDRPEYVFDHWSGDVPAGKERDNPLTITMDRDKTITAHFVENPAWDAPPPENTLSVDFTVSGQCQASQSGCTCTVNYAVNAEDISSGDKYPVTNVKLEVNDGTGWREWHNSGGISLPYYHHPGKETGVACGKTFSVRATATNSVGQTVTATGTFTTQGP